MPYTIIDPSRVATPAPVSEDLMQDFKGNEDYLYGIIKGVPDANGAPLVVNGSFEADVPGTMTPTEWDWAPQTSGVGAVASDDQVHGGQSYKVIQDTTPGHGGGSLKSHSFMNVSYRLEYRVLYHFKASIPGVRIIAKVYWYNSAGGAASTATTTIFDGGVTPTAPTIWAVFCSHVTPPSDAVFAKLEVTAGDSSVTPVSTCSVWVDGLSMTLAIPHRGKASYTANGSYTVPSGVFNLNVEGYDSYVTAVPEFSYFRKWSVSLDVKPGDVVTVQFLNAGASGTYSQVILNGVTYYYGFNANTVFHFQGAPIDGYLTCSATVTSVEITA